MWLLEQQNPVLMEMLRTESRLNEARQSLLKLSRLRAVAVDREEVDYGPVPFSTATVRPGIAYMLKLLDAEPEFLKDTGYLPLAEAAKAARQAAHHFVPFCDTTRNERVHDVPPSTSKAQRGTNVPTKAQAPQFFSSDGTPISDALMHVENVLTAMDDGRRVDFWANVYTQKLGEWLEQDLPEIAFQLATETDSGMFFGRTLDYVREMQSVESHWHRLGEVLRAILLGPLCTPGQVYELIPRFLEAGVEPYMDEEEYDAVHIERLWQMMLLRKNAPVCDGRAVTFACDESSDAVDSIREDSRNHSTAYLIDATALPERLVRMVGERQCLALTVPEERLELIEHLSAQHYVARFEFESADKMGITHHLAVNHSFWCPYDDLWPLLFAFREHIPILYIFEETCLLVTYRFRHFVTLRGLDDLTRHTMPCYDADTETHDGQLPSYICRLADGTTIRPKIIEQIQDVRTSRASRRLCEAFERDRRTENPEGSNWSDS
ncbi:hypothetical protein PQR70_36720 [Paraburkholderia madseniana]|uniref:hypothetical protein n=1 Tax=Paraburkholderia madseniana TaxID=2599607 RepID=UPI0038B8D5D1